VGIREEFELYNQRKVSTTDLIDFHEEMVREREKGMYNGGEENNNLYVEIVNRRGDLIVKDMINRLIEMTGKDVDDSNELKVASNYSKEEKIVDNEGDSQGEEEREDSVKPIGVKRIIDKMLTNYKNIALIHLIFPDAVILHTMRDPMDTLFSCYKNKFNDDSAMWAHNVTTLVAEYVIYLEIMQHFRNELPKGRIIDVSYEALIAAPEATMRRIVTSTDILGLSWDPMVMRFTESNRTIHTASVLQVKKPIYSNSVGIWRKYQKELKPVISELQKQTPRLIALGALPSIEVINVLNTQRITMNWDFDPYFDYNGMMKRLQSVSIDRVSPSDTNSTTPIMDMQDNEKSLDNMNTSVKICSDKDTVMTAVLLTFQSLSLFLINSTVASNHAEYMSINQLLNSDTLPYSHSGECLDYFIVGLFCYISCFFIICVVIFLYFCPIGCSLRFTCRG
jgi:hypothetical protein